MAFTKKSCSEVVFEGEWIHHFLIIKTYSMCHNHSWFLTWSYGHAMRADIIYEVVLESSQTGPKRKSTELLKSGHFPLRNSPFGKVYSDLSTSSILRSIMDVLFLKAVQYYLQFHFDFIHAVEVVLLSFWGTRTVNTVSYWGRCELSSWCCCFWSSVKSQWTNLTAV